MNKLSQLVTEYRKKRGISQAKLAKSLGYGNPQFVSNWERGKCQVPKNKIRDISKILRISNLQILDAAMTDLKEEVLGQLKGA